MQVRTVPSATRRAARLLATAALLSSASAALLSAQSGTTTFGGLTNDNGAAPTASFSGPALTFSSVGRTGFGNTNAISGAEGRWWTANFSGQGMLYGLNASTANVLEITLDAGEGFNLNLTSALFGAWLDRAANITYRLYNADYTQSTSPFTVLTGTMTPASPMFATNGWGRVIRLQFTETDAAAFPTGRGAIDVGVQGIGYTRTVASVVPEPSTYALMATGLAALAFVRRKRVARVA